MGLSMSGDNHYQPGPDLPMPQPERFNNSAPEQPDEVERQPIRSEKASQVPELPPSPPSAGPPPSQTLSASPFVPPPLPSAPDPPLSGSATTIPVIDVPDTADDTDLIEKEWVNKAKHIVETSRDNPNLQNKEISKLKADYIQKRYNKQLKVSED
jgi:hypothetical protein